MCIHVFGNNSSPAVASSGLKKSVEGSEKDVKDYVTHDFYVDDGVTSKPTTGEVIDLIKRTQCDLALCKLRLHKIASSSVEVMKAFDVSELSKDLKHLDFDEVLPVQHS